MDFVTVCFHNDLPQMKLQARSLDKFLHNFPVGQILIIVNDDFALSKDYLETQVLLHYGSLKNKVKIINGHDVVVPHHDKYFNQMLLKIMAVNYVNDEHYCILDAKNFLVKEWQYTDVYDTQKRLRARYSQLQSQWEQGCRKSFEFFNLNYSDYQKVLQHTPFFAHTNIVKKLANLPNFISSFKKDMLVEFPMIQAATIAEYGSFESAYWIADDGKDFKLRYTSCIWPIDCNMINVDKGLFENKIEWQLLYPKGKVLSSGIHRNCFNLLSKTNEEKLILIWEQLGISNQIQSKEIIDEMKLLNP
jgi:hypothetical protein